MTPARFWTLGVFHAVAVVLFLRVEPRSLAVRGRLHDFAGVPLHVARGVGVERGFAPLVRFLCPPEICVVDLQLPVASYRAASFASRRTLRSTPQR